MKTYQAPGSVDNVNPSKLNEVLAEANVVRAPDNGCCGAIVNWTRIGHWAPISGRPKNGQNNEITSGLKSTLYTSLGIVTLLTTAATKKR